MKSTSSKYQNWQNQMKVTGVVSLNEFMEQGSDIPEDSNNRSSSFVKPEEAMEKEELKKMLAESLEKLTDKEKKVILLYYYEELTLKEIAEVLEVSESRVSQLHTRALQKMREKLGDYLGIVTGSR